MTVDDFGGRKEPFIFVSHASSDKHRPEFLSLLRAMVDAEIPLGIDEPAELRPYGFSETDFAWRLRYGEPYDAELTNCVNRHSGAALIVWSKAYGKDVTQSGSAPWMRFKEAMLALHRHDQETDSFPIFLAALDDDIPSLSHEIKGIHIANLFRGPGYVDALITQLNACKEQMRRKALAPDAALQTYLHALIAKYQDIPLFGFRKRDRFLKLDHVYAALRGNLRVAAEERDSAYRRFRDELDDFRGTRGWDEYLGSDALEPDFIAQRQRGHMRGLASGIRRDSSIDAQVGDRLTLAEATSELRKLVVLGAPGSGKTTLAQWLALTYARGMLADPLGTIQVPGKHVDPESESDDLIPLGSPRAPILIRVQRFAEEFEASGRTLQLIDYLGRHDWRPLGSAAGEWAIPSGTLEEAFHREFAAGRVVLILDGLDEIHAPGLRQAVLDQIVRFDARMLRSGAGARKTGEIKFGNQLIVTSRIVGYDALPLPEDWPHVVIEPMSETTVRSYWTRLLTAIADRDTPEEIKSDVARLHEQVFSAELTGVSELARIPLLAAFIAASFVNSGLVRLPEYRVEIYDETIKVLVEQRWRERTGESVRNWCSVLAPIARTMHENVADSMLSANELRSQLMTRLGERSSNLRTHSERQAAVEAFLKETNENVGLLVERSPGTYAFLHRTFQEYLAALWLIEDPMQAFARITDRWVSPRWREVVLLAFGQLGLPDTAMSGKDVEQLLQRLIEAARERSVSQSLKLIAEGISEMPSLPRTGAVEALATIVLERLLADAGPPSETEALRDGIVLLAGRAPLLIESVIGGMLRSGDPARQRAALRAIIDERWFSEAITDGLEACRQSSEPEVVGMTRLAMRRAIQDDAVQSAVVRPTPPSELSEQDETALAQRDPSSHARYLLEHAVARKRYRYELKRFRARHALARRHPYRPPGPVNALLARVGRNLVGDFGWRALIAGLFGGLDDRMALAAVREYDELARLLSRDDGPREALLSHRRGLTARFGGGDTIYNIALALDSGRISPRPAAIAPSFDLERVVGLADIPQSIFDGLNNGIPSGALAAELVANLGTQPSAARPAAVLGAVLADTQGELALRRLVGRLSDSERTELANLASRAIADVADACFRALYKPLAARFVAARALPSAQKDLCARVILDTAVRVYADEPISIAHWDGYGPQVFAETMLNRLAGIYVGDDVAYNIDVILDTIGGHVRSVLEAAPEASVATWLERHAHWPVSQLAPRSSAYAGDIPLQLIDVVDTAPLSRFRTGWRNVLFKFVRPATPHQDLINCLAPRTFDMLFVKYFFGENHIVDNGRHAIEAMVGTIHEPYFKARGLADLAIHTGEASFAWRAASEADHIQDHASRAMVLERVAAIQLTGHGAAVLRRAISAARRISDPRDAWRLCLRLAQDATPFAARRLIRHAGRALARIVDDWDRAEDSWIAARFVGREFVQRALFRSRLWQGSDVLRVIAAPAPAAAMGGNLRALVALPLRAEPDSEQEGAPDSNALLPLYVARACLDVIDTLDSKGAASPAALKSAWNRVAKGNLEALREILQSPNSSNRKLNEECAVAIQALAQRIDREPDAQHWTILLTDLLGRLDTNGPGSLSAARRWLESRHTVLRHEAALIIANHLGLKERFVVTQLCEALSSECEAHAVRASSMLSRGTPWLDRPERVLRVSDLELGLLDDVGAFLARSHSVEAMKPLSSHAAALFVEDLIFDDPDTLARLCDAVSSDAGARRIVGRVRALTPEAGELFLRRITQAHERGECHADLLTTLSQACYNASDAFKTQIDSWYAENGDAFNLMVCPGRVAAVTRAIEHALADATLSIDDRVAAARVHFREAGLAHTVDLVRLGAAPHQALAAGAQDTSIHSLSGWNPRPSKALETILPDIPDAQDAVAALLERSPSVAERIAVQWLNQLLTERPKTKAGRAELLYVVFCASIMAQHSPDLFWQNVEQTSRSLDFADRLISAAFDPDALGHSAIAATRILATAPRVDHRIVDLILREAKGPDPFCQETAEEALGYVTNATPAAIDNLLKALTKAPPRVAKVAASTLALIARDAMGNPEQRQRIVEGMSSALGHPATEAELWIFIPGSQLDPGEISSMGPLRANLLEMLAIIDQGV